jgi:antitoxin CcdA
MRVICAHDVCVGNAMNAVAKKSTNLSLPEDVLESARALKLNLSRELETHLRSVIREKRGEQWRLENREAIQAINAQTERDFS